MPRTARVQVLLANSEAERFEACCRTKGYTKSTLIARLIQEHLDSEHFYPKPNLLQEARQ